MSAILLKQIGDVVARALPHLSTNQILEIAEHLVSDDVGVTSLADLTDLTLDLMPKLPPLKQRQLFSALKDNQWAAPEQVASASTAASSSETVQQQVPRQLDVSHRDAFGFKVVWNDLPQKVLVNLELANKKKEMADPADVAALKLAIAKKLVSSYTTYRENNPGSQKSPGGKLYRNITEQVFSKFSHCFKVKVNEKVIGDGQHTFMHLLEVCTENILRRHHSKNSAGPTVRAKKGKGSVGVLINEYEPSLTQPNKEEQEGIKTHLQNYYLLDCREQDMESVSRDLEKAYALIRANIVSAKEDVCIATNNQNRERRNGSGTDDEDVDCDLLQEPALKRLRKEWPFLFQPDMIKIHHNRLTGRNIHLEMEKFCENKLEILILFMTTCSNSNVENMALRLKAESHYNDLDTGEKFIMALIMVSNHFKENNNLLIYCAEKTLYMEELNLEESRPCIVVMGQDLVGAKDYIVCSDKTPLVRTNNGCDAVRVLFEICLIFDLQYPNLPLTMEFYERYVFGMGFSDTRVEKKGKQLITLTDAVKRIINGLQTFEDRLKQLDNNGKE